MGDLIEASEPSCINIQRKAKKKKKKDTLYDYIYKHFVSSSGHLIKSDFVVCYRFLALGHTVTC
jgi:hypothetical protein